MRHTLQISVSKKPVNGGAVSVRCVSISVVRQIICTYILHIKCACISDGMDKHSKFLHLFAQLI